MKTIFILVLFGFAVLATATCDSVPIIARAILYFPYRLIVGKNFLIKCKISLPSNYTADYKVTFYLNGKPTGQYVVANDGSTTWETVNLINGLNVYHYYDPNATVFPNYTALHQPTSKTAEGVYSCSVTLPVPHGGEARFFSGEWDAKDESGIVSIPPEVGLAYRNVPAVSQIQVGKPFLGVCSVYLSNPRSNYNVSFHWGSLNSVRYVVKAEQSIPSVYYVGRNSDAFLNVFRGNHTTYPTFTVYFEPKASHATNEKFHCSLSLDVPPGGYATYRSRDFCTMPKYC